MTKAELIKMIELLPDDCEIKIKHNGNLHTPIESSWWYTMSEEEQLKVQNEWSNKVQDDINKTKQTATLYVLTF